MFPETFMLSTRSLLRSGCRSSVSRAGELVWFDPSRPVTKVSAAQVHTNVIRAACLTTHVQLREGKTGLIVSCRRRSSNMTWGEEAPAEVAAALPHYAQVIAFQALFVIQDALLLGTNCERLWQRIYRTGFSYSQLFRRGDGALTGLNFFVLENYAASLAP